MKKFIIPALLFAAVMTTSCGSDAVEATDAKEVKDVKITATYGTLAENNSVDWRAWHYGKTGPRFGVVTISDAEASVNESMLAGGKFVLDIASLTVTSIEDSAKAQNLTDHLTSGDFFQTDSFPTATFEITDVDTASGDFNTKISGNLTIKGVSKNITFKANSDISEENLTLNSETFEVDRLDWGLNYKAEGLTGVIANESIHNDIAFTIHVNLTK